MANKTQILTETFTGDGDATDNYHAMRGGVLLLEAVRTAGTMTLTLQVSLDGTNFADAVNASGTAISSTLNSSSPNWHVEHLIPVDSYWKIVASGSASTPSVQTYLGPTTA